MKKFILLLIFIFGVSTFAFGQDTLRTNYKDKPRWDANANKAKQNQQRANRVDRFIDEDGDGINDIAQERFERRLQNRSENRNEDGTCDGEMNRYRYNNRNQNQTGLGDGQPTGNGGDDATKTQKGKN